MAKDLEEALVNQKAKLGGEEKPHMDLGGHLEYIESLLEHGAEGGGKSVPPTLNLIDPESDEVRATITEEEKTNLENGLYNQVLYPDGTPFGYFMSSKMLGDKSLGINMFAQFYPDMNTGSITSFALYSFSIGGKDTSGNYPITIEKQGDIPVGGSGGGNIWYNLNTTSGTITQNQYDEIKSLIDSNSLAGIKDTTLGIYFPLVNSENNGTFTFGHYGLGSESTGSNTKYSMTKMEMIIKSDLSVSFSLKDVYVPMLTQNLSSQSIPSIKTDGYQENLTIGDGLTIENGVLKTTGGGGKSVSPTLNLFDFKNGRVRTTITEEEYNNLANGLYNQVIYIGGNDPLSMYSPSKLFSIDGVHVFIQFKIVANVDETASYSSMVVNSITIGEKNTSNEYPITVTNEVTINPPSASGGSNIDKLDIEFKFNGTTTLTQEQVSLINSYNNKYVYVKFNEGIVRDNAYIGYVLNLGDLGTIISIVSGVNISGNLIIQSFISIQGTTAVHKENTIEFSEANSDKFLKTNAQGEPEWASISTPTITFED